MSQNVTSSSFTSSFSFTHVFMVGLGLLLGLVIGYYLSTIYSDNSTNITPQTGLALRVPNTENPIVVELLSHEPKIVLLHNFLSDTECQHLKTLAEQLGLKRSTVQGEKNEIHPDRTSTTVNLQKQHDEVVKKIEQRAAMLCTLPPENIENLQVVRYQKGQQYRPHYDFFVPGAKGTEGALKRGGQRHVTFFVYLNDLPDQETGGHTEFPKLKLKIKPEKGMAVFWMNVKSDKTEDFNTLHSGNPPVMDSTVKLGLNIWVREKAFK